MQITTSLAARCSDFTGYYFQSLRGRASLFYNRWRLISSASYSSWVLLDTVLIPHVDALLQFTRSRRVRIRKKQKNIWINFLDFSYNFFVLQCRYYLPLLVWLDGFFSFGRWYQLWRIRFWFTTHFLFFNTPRKIVCVHKQTALSKDLSNTVVSTRDLVLRNCKKSFQSANVINYFSLNIQQKVV